MNGSESYPFVPHEQRSMLYKSKCIYTMYLLSKLGRNHSQAVPQYSCIPSNHIWMLEPLYIVERQNHNHSLSTFQSILIGDTFNLYPFLFNPFLFNSFLFNPFLFNPFLFNPFLFNPFLFNPFHFNSFLFNSFLFNPFFFNPFRFSLSLSFLPLLRLEIPQKIVYFLFSHLLCIIMFYLL